MFKNISWENYFLVITLLLAIYYLYLGIRFNSRGSFKSKLRPASGSIVNNEVCNSHGADADYNENHRPDLTSTENSFSQMSLDLCTEKEPLNSLLIEIITDSESKNHTKEVLMRGLSQALKNYPQLKDISEQAINKIIISICEKHSSIRLSEEDLGILWIELR